MKRRISLVFSLGVPLLLSLAGAPLAPANDAKYEVPFQVDYKLIIVNASYRQFEDLRFVVDTGATASFLHKNTITKLGLKPEGVEVPIKAFGRSGKAKRYWLAGLKIGTMFTTLHCLEADLSGWGVDGIIGLDLLLRETYVAHNDTHEVLKNKNFTIDFEAARIRFGCEETVENAVPVNLDGSQMVIETKIEDRPVRMALDTGSQVTILFQRSAVSWISRLPVVGVMNVFNVFGRDRQKRVMLSSVKVGTAWWATIYAVLSNARNPKVDGLLSVSPLGLKMLHFDAARKLLAFEQ